ncbi:MAG: glutathione S-transferase family protein [Deltaproteobacteria bacterium]|nr:glutathione S-transferase family protein [Deltaproteobacteria bacterium]
MRLYDLPRSPWSQQVRIVLAEKGLAHERHIVLPGQELESWYQELNPLARTPTLVDRDLVLRESSVIAEYLEEAYPDHPLMPESPAERAVVRMVVSFVEQYLGPPMEDLALALAAGDEVDPHDLEELRADCELAFELLSEILVAGQTHAAGERYSLADVALAPFLLGMVEPLDLGETLAAQENVAAYCTRLSQRTSSRVVEQSLAEWAEMISNL